MAEKCNKCRACCFKNFTKCGEKCSIFILRIMIRVRVTYVWFLMRGIKCASSVLQTEAYAV